MQRSRTWASIRVHPAWRQKVNYAGAGLPSCGLSNRELRNGGEGCVASSAGNLKVCLHVCKIISLPWTLLMSGCCASLVLRGGGERPTDIIGKSGYPSGAFPEIRWRRGSGGTHRRRSSPRQGRLPGRPIPFLFLRARRGIQYPPSRNTLQMYVTALCSAILLPIQFAFRPLARPRPKFGRTIPNMGPSFVELDPKFSDFGPMSARNRPCATQLWSNSAQISSNSARQPVLTTIRATQATTSPFPSPPAFAKRTDIPRKTWARQQVATFEDLLKGAQCKEHE